jgi:hypothetical protein
MAGRSWVFENIGEAGFGFGFGLFWVVFLVSCSISISGSGFGSGSGFCSGSGDRLVFPGFTFLFSFSGIMDYMR